MKFRYITFKDAPHLKTKGQPDEMIAEIREMEVGEKNPPKPWTVATPVQLVEYENSIADKMLAWQKTQPFLVEVDGQRQERLIIDGELKPRPSLEPNNS